MRWLSAPTAVIDDDEGDDADSDDGDDDAEAELSAIRVVTETSGDGSVRRSLALPSAAAAAPPPPAWSPRSQRGVVEAEVAGEESPAAAVEARPAARGRLAIRKSRSSSVK